MSTAIITRRKRAPAILELVALLADAQTDAAILLEPQRLEEMQVQQARRERAILWAPTYRPAIAGGRGEKIIYTDRQS